MKRQAGNTWINDHQRQVDELARFHSQVKYNEIVYTNQTIRDDLSISHEIVYDELVNKLNILAAAKIYFLQLEIARYWKVN